MDFSRDPRGAKPKGEKAMTDAERQKIFRAKKRAEGSRFRWVSPEEWDLILAFRAEKKAAEAA